MIELPKRLLGDSKPVRAAFHSRIFFASKGGQPFGGYAD
jgi:hypothetical protein